MICADGFAGSQVVSRVLARMGADVILSPSAWAVDADHDNARDPYGKLWRDCYAPVARDLRPVDGVGVSNVGPITAGPWAGRKCIGCSLAVGPGGRDVLRGPTARTRSGAVRGRSATPAQGSARESVGLRRPEEMLYSHTDSVNVPKLSAADAGMNSTTAAREGLAASVGRCRPRCWQRHPCPPPGRPPRGGGMRPAGCPGKSAR